MKHSLKTIKGMVLALALILLAACGSSQPPVDTDVDRPTDGEFVYTAKVDIGEKETQAALEARYGGSTIIFKPEAGFAILGFDQEAGELSTLNLNLNQDTFTSPEASAAGYQAWGGGYRAWGGGYKAWGGGYKAWGGGDSAPTTYVDNLTAWKQINLAKGQRIAPKLGAGVKIAVIDTGLTTSHPAFEGRKLDWDNQWDFVANDGNSWDDWTSGMENSARGHGTAVASIILQVAPEATILPIRVLDSDGKGDTDDIVSAIDWAVSKNVDIINLSVGTNIDVPELRAMLDYAASQGVFTIASAGNEGGNLTYPARWANDGSALDPYLISVGSVDAENRKSVFSNFGSGMEVLAPGEGVQAALRKTNDVFEEAGVTGTSFAAPMVTGALALAMGERPDMSPRTDYQHKLNHSTKDVSSLNLGFVNSLGHGLLDVEAYLKDMGCQEPAGEKEALFVVGNLPYNAGDAQYAERLELLGFNVTPVDDGAAYASSANGKDLVLISSSVSSGATHSKFRDVSVPVVTFEESIFDDMKMATSKGNSDGVTEVQMVNSTHPLSMGLTDTVPVTDGYNDLAWGVVGEGAIKIATDPSDSNKAAVFAYETGAQMVGMSAPARRVGLFHNYYHAPNSFLGWAFFDSAVQWASSQPYVLFVGDESNPGHDAAAKQRLEDLGFAVVSIDDDASKTESGYGKDLIVISSTTNSGDVNTKFTDLSVPVVNWEPWLYDDLGMALDHSEADSTGGQTHVNLLDTPLNQGLTGSYQVLTSAQTMSWAVPEKTAIKLATLNGDPNKAVVFGYDTGAKMYKNVAPARRAGLFLNNYGAANLSELGNAIFDGVVTWALQGGLR